MGLGRYFRALSVPFVIGCVAFYSGAALSQASISYDPPTSAKVQKAIDAVTDRTEKQALADASGVITRLVQVAFQSGAVGPARGHRDLRLQHPNQRVLSRPRLTQILHDLLL